MMPDNVIEAMAGAFTWERRSDEGVVAALAAAEAMGWKLVPREPNDDMTGAFDRHCDEHGQCMVRTGWRAMYDAAPSVKP